MCSYDVLGDWQQWDGGETVGCCAPCIGLGRVKLSGVTSQFALDVFVPSIPPDYHWLGSLNAFVECPSVGLYKTFLGYRALQILHESTFNRVTFDLGAPVLAALQGPAQNCRFMFEIAQNPAYGPLARDRGGFVGEP